MKEGGEREEGGQIYLPHQKNYLQIAQSYQG